MAPAPPGTRPATEVRAYHVRSTLLLLDEDDRTAAARVRARVGEAPLSAAEDASRLAWIPGLVDVELWRAIDAEFGRGGLMRLARRVGVRHVRAGHLTGLLEGVVQLFGLSPPALLRWVPRGLSEVHRGVGEFRIAELSDRTGRLVLQGMHPCLVGEPWLAAVAGSLEFALEVCGLDGQAELEESGPERAVFTLRWRPRGAP